MYILSYKIKGKNSFNIINSVKSLIENKEKMYTN